LFILNPYRWGLYSKYLSAESFLNYSSLKTEGIIMAKQSPKELRAKIAARKAERKTEKIRKYAKMRSVATKAPEKLEKHLIRLADKYASHAEGIENLRENLGLVRAAKEAPLKIRVAAAKEYGKKFRRIAEESPEKLEEALVEAYQGLNDIAQDIEFAADQMGVDLNVQEDFKIEDGVPGELEVEVPDQVVEEAEAEGETPEFEAEEKLTDSEPEDEVVEEKEAAGSGSDAWVTDRDETGSPKAPEQVDVPRVAAGGGSDPWVTDRDKSGQPEAPKEVEIPQSQGKAAKKVTPAGKSATGSL